jgi:anti-sigma regulatory factor (Ser/Thr protein kinase)
VHSTLLRIDDSTRVAEARRHATALAHSEGLGEQAAQEVALIASEIATNVFKHAHAGEVHLTGLSVTGEAGVELLSIDRGPGMANWRECLADGYSTRGTAGTGLGAISRLADVFDVYSQPDQGTVLVARKFSAAKSRPSSERWTVGAVKVCYPGETACGDNWSIRRNGHATSFIVADGLGHGILAADASAAAVRAFHGGRADSAAPVLEAVHLALRSTRGAAVAIIRIDHGRRTVCYAGLGNIAGVLLGGARPQFMVSHSGTAGLEVRRLQEFDYQLPAEPVIVMHSDGLTSNWSMDSYPGLVRRHPSIIAGVLYRDASRGRDDVCVLVGRCFAE